MTSNERKIINFLRDAKEKTHIRLIAKKTNFSNDYMQSLCHSLARAGYIKLEDSNVTLLTDEPAGTPLASDRDDKADDDVELDKALVDLEPPSPKDESEEKEKPEELKDETENESRELEEEKTEEIAEKPKEVLAETDPAPEQARYGAGATEGEKMEKPDETELKPELKAEEEKPIATEAVAGKEKELTGEAKAENPEKVALKEEPVKPSGGFGASFKKIVPIVKLSRILDKVGINWFAEKN